MWRTVQNKFDFVNVCSHADDFQVPCEWIFSTAKEPVTGLVAQSSGQLTARAFGARFQIKF